MKKIWSLKTLSIVLVLCFFNISSSAWSKPWPNIALNQVVTGLHFPTFITNAADKSGRLFLVEKAGTIRILRDGVLLDNFFLDISGRVGSSGDDGLMGLAFPPGFKKKQYFYVYYTGLDGNPVLSRFHISAANPDIADPDSEEPLLNFTGFTVSDPAERIHIGGWIGFHPRNHRLYISTGDTGPQGDPNNNSQNPGVLMGKMLRIDVEHGPETIQPFRPYRIPRSNPFVNTPGYLPEIWALGLRNPFRCSFDSLGRFYIADVGYNTSEEIDFEPVGSKGGKNYGWNILEGFDFTGLPPNPAIFPPNYQAPVASFSHADNFECIIGGYVFQGPKFWRMRGVYFFANFGENFSQGPYQIWGMRRSENWASKLLLEIGFPISTFGVDEKRNLYVANIENGIIYQIVDTLP
jgi:glucose/arabinose dehydrogenase